MSACFFRTNTIYLAIWVSLMLYGFYSYLKKVNFKNMSLGHFLCASFICFWSGYITTAMFFGIEHLHLLPFMPFGIITIIGWYKFNSTVFLIGMIAAISFLPMFYYLVIKRIQYNLNITKLVIIVLWSGIFISGYMSFLYVLSWNIF